MGGLGEDATFAQAEAGLVGSAPGGVQESDRRGEAGGVAHADVLHKPSEAEQVLQLILQQLRGLQNLSKFHGTDPTTAAPHVKSALPQDNSVFACASFLGHLCNCGQKPRSGSRAS